MKQAYLYRNRTWCEPQRRHTRTYTKHATHTHKQTHIRRAEETGRACEKRLWHSDRGNIDRMPRLIGTARRKKDGKYRRKVAKAASVNVCTREANTISISKLSCGTTATSAHTQEKHFKKKNRGIVWTVEWCGAMARTIGKYEHIDGVFMRYERERAYSSLAICPLTLARLHRCVCVRGPLDPCRY